MGDLFIGDNRITSEFKEVYGGFVKIDGEKFYQIKNYDRMSPFFISIASDSDHWMYISSTGGLTAGRRNPDQALFPYYTDDKIHESAEITGSKTILHVKKGEKNFLWEPFSERNKGIYKLERTISKSTIGNKIIFEEKNLDLGLTFCYGWMNSDEFGWIKKSWLINNTAQTVEVIIIDGLQNILPYGVTQLTQNTFSTLVDAYKKSELIEEANLALFRMESIMADRAEPSEALRVTTVWNFGLEKPTFLLSSNQLDNLRNGIDITPESESKGVKGAFLACSNLRLEASKSKTWYFIAELNQDSTKVNNLIEFIKNNKNLANSIESSIDKGNKSLLAIVAQSDGVQQTADEHRVARHFSNVLFNTMRGGYYSQVYTIDSADFCRHIKHFNLKVWQKNEKFLENLPSTIQYSELEKLVQNQSDTNLYRLFLEYLPLTFSRRHGDPSRPWNRFDIKVKDENGNKLLSYQGNWRDIFQNWEALSLSYPEYINGIIAKFLNASTADGYNPYKLTNEGIEWEVIEHENPWSNIGYWGDHQIIYLLKLMEVSRNHFPDVLVSWLNKEMFAYANVPYRIKSYNEIVVKPKNSIVFDDSLHRSIEKLVPSLGADAKLIIDKNGEVVLVSFTEKLLTTLLAKLSNFIPEAGIWMNTLRPEWNDANNALVGYGASMVTLYNMRRFVVFVNELFSESLIDKFSVSSEIGQLLQNINGTFNKNAHLLSKSFDNSQRRSISDELGEAGSTFRNFIYKGISGSKVHITKNELIDFLNLSLKYIDQSIEANKRPDGMYHSYNLVSFTDDAISIRRLYEMLEGQVSVLGSGKLNAEETLNLLNALRNSALYRVDQNSYILYPNKRLPQFLEKNIIPKEDVDRIKFLKDLINRNDTSIITKDKRGQFHFNADFANAEHLKKALYQKVIQEKERQEILNIYEKIFDHQSFTGRSGTFYKYEGLGSIYWHMVSKLLLAVGESIKTASTQNVSLKILNQLINHYYEIQNGIGAHKSPAEYGSFPFDPYSHTPIMAGVQQPGMTGQVKEDIISRFNELGISIKNGQICINPQILLRNEFIEAPIPWLEFTYCSVTIRYLIDGNRGIEIHQTNNRISQIMNYEIPLEFSQSIFLSKKDIQRIIVHFDRK